MQVKKIHKTGLSVLLIAILMIAFIFGGSSLIAARAEGNAETLSNVESQSQITTRKEYYFLDISIVKKEGGYWTIAVKNNSASKISFEYNKKMVFASDARNWTNIDHLGTGEVDVNKTTNIEIRQNVFADYITLCWLDQGDRVITYANGLKTGGSMDVKNAVILG